MFSYLTKCAKRTKKNQKGFSLIELMTVVAILGVLYVVLEPNVGGFWGNTNKAGVKNHLQTIRAGLNTWIINQPPAARIFPATPGDSKLNSLAAAVIDNIDARLLSNTADPWGNPYYYNRLTNTTARLSSAGVDGTLGNADDKFMEIQYDATVQAIIVTTDVQ